MNDQSITVVGAGIVGTCCALALQQEGRQVTLIDQAGPGEGCSYGNSGCISPASVVPMSTPGMLGKIPGWLADPQGPLTVRWRHLASATPWLAQWVREGRIDRVRRNAAALAALNGPVFDNYRRLLAPEQFDDVIRMIGHLYVWRTPNRGPGDALARRIREAHGIRMQWLAADEVRALEPAVSPEFVAGLFLPDNGYTCNPERLVKTLAANFTAMGGHFLRRRVLGFEIGADGPRRIYTDCGSLPARTLVIAAGAFSTRLAGSLAPAIPLETERGYHAMLANPNVTLRHPVMDVERKYIATPMEHGLRLAGTVEIGGLDAPPDWRRANTLLEHGRRLLPGLESGDASVWMGYRPSLPDSVPVIDRSPRFPTVYLAFGHGHLGMTGGPGTGRLLADIVAGRRPWTNPAPFSSTRFG
jgi:glycine/D-amino acid oxidase-like deaminating enzyme